MNTKTRRLTAGIALLLIGLSLILAVNLTAPRTVRANPGMLYVAPGDSTPQSEDSWHTILTQEHTAQANKLSASLSLAYHLWTEHQRIREQTSPRSVSEIEAVESLTSKLALQMNLHMEAPEPGANVLIHTTDDAKELEALGITVQARVGDMATAYIPFSRLQEVAALPSVVYIEASQILHPANDVSVPETGAPQLWSGGVTGSGVIVGVIDSGIDPFHPDFINPDGTTRIKYLLDFSDPGDPDSDGTLNGPVFGGTMYTEAQINTALANPGWFYLSSDTPRSIPDNSATGTTSQISVSEFANITSAAVDVYITHGYVGDLRVVLTCPSGTTTVLHDRSGGSRDDIIGTFPVAACNGQNAQGTWSLRVSDHASGDTGRLIFWNLHLNRPVRMTDQVGHGTHAAGSAAGNGRGTPAGTFKGMAPGANIIAVRATRDYVGGFMTSDIVNALSFIDQKAQELGLPYVINLSLGGHMGPHDGTTLEDRTIDNLVGSGKPGKAIVVAAGNEGDEAIHAGGTLSQGGNVSLRVNVPSGGGFFVADIWYKGSDTFGVGFVSPTGASLNPAPVPPGSQKCYQQGNPAVAIVCVTHANNNLYNGDKEIVFQVISLLSGTWQLILRGDSVINGRYDGWILGCCGWVNPDNQMRVGMPGTARNAITVGAYTTKNQWTDVDGNPRSRSATVGDIAAFSSDGPTRDGRLKPEVAAPGQMICSTLSGQSPAGSIGSMYPNRSWICQGGRHGISMGTSFAAPHVTGAVALLLSTNRNLDAMQLRDMLTSAAKRDSFTGATPNNRWGYGKLNVAAFARKRLYLPLVLRNYSPPVPSTPTPTPTPGGPTLTATPTWTQTTTAEPSKPMDGEWCGRNDQDQLCPFRVGQGGTSVTTFTLRVSWGGTCGVAYTEDYFYNIPIINNAFSESSSSRSITGNFTSATTATGTYWKKLEVLNPPYPPCTATRSGSWSASLCPTPTPTRTPTLTPTHTLTPTPTWTPTASSTPTPSATPTSTSTFTPTYTPGGPTLTPSHTPTHTTTPIPTPTLTPTPTLDGPTPTPPAVSRCNTTPITIRDYTTASPYPSTITVSGLATSIVDVNVRLLGLTHTWPDDIDILLVGPQGQNLVIMSDAGGSVDVSNINLTLDDGAAQALPDDGPLSNGVYRPMNYGTGDTFPFPAPTPSSATALAVFNATNPNGTWSLYIVDDTSGDTGTLSGGWCLDIVVSDSIPTSTPTPGGPTPTPSAWEILVNTDFEGDFPGPWTVYDENGSTDGDYYWGKRNCRAHAGSFSGWAVGAGANGAGLSCGSNYPNNARSSMDYGPFSLEGSSAAELRYKVWQNTELDYDRVCHYASVNKSQWYGTCWSGNSSGWVDRVFDLSNVYQLGSLLGQPQVWVKLRFYSDSSVTYAEGAYVDNIVLRRCPQGATCPTGSLSALPTGDQITESPAHVTLISK